MLNILKYLIFISSFCFWVNEADATGNDCQHKYSIVIDGGSTGTRLNLFKFDNKEKIPKVVKSFVFKYKVPLSKFSDTRQDWGLMRLMITNLTDSALQKVPDACVNTTPIYIQVTAGVRLLEKSIGERILNNLREFLLTKRFYFNNSFVAILSPSDEGQLAWISVNFMLHGFQDENTVGVLDMGGGSTQIAFATEDSSLKQMTSKINLFGKNYSIYSKGYESMGINEVRIKYFNAQDCSEDECKTKVFRSECVNKNVSTLFKFGNKALNIAGETIDNHKRFNACFGTGTNLIITNNMITNIRSTFVKKNFVAISAYYYILKSAGNITKKVDNDFNEVKVGDIVERAQAICEDPQETSNNKFTKFLCMDLSYIICLFSFGYGFEQNFKILTALKIKELELSWALGYAISKY